MALDLFAGAAGGWSLGLHRAGIRTVAACEIDEWRRTCFAANNPGVRLYGDVRDLTAARLVADLGCLPDIIVGSPPCQDISSANPRGRGVDGERSGLFFEAVRLVRECRPVWGCFENSSHARVKGIDRVLSALEAEGYSCWPLVVGADDLMAPHRRKRMWLVFADTDERRIRPEQARPVWPGRLGMGSLKAEKSRSWNHPDANREGQSRQPEHGEVGGPFVVSGHADSAGLALGQGQRGDAFAEFPALERAVGPVGYRWNGGPARYRRVADGCEPRLARQLIAALGDSVLPQITEAIARACLSAFSQQRAAA
jgi:DNA (cytosine-5)-methyltransferase 1